MSPRYYGPKTFIEVLIISSSEKVLEFVKTCFNYKSKLSFCNRRKCLDRKEKFVPNNLSKKKKKF